VTIDWWRELGGQRLEEVTPHGAIDAEEEAVQMASQIGWFASGGVRKPPAEK
jgi:hypothetical protein